MMRYLLSLSTMLLLLAGTAHACVVGQPVRRVVVTKPVVAVATPAVTVAPVAVFAPLTVAVPVYSAGYNPGYNPGYAPGAAPGQPPAQPQPGLADVLRALQGINARLDALEKRGAPAAPGPVVPAPPRADPFAPRGKAQADTGPHPALALFAAKCSQCHLKGKDDQGGGFVLLDQPGVAAKLDARALLAVSRRSYNGTMPPRKSGVPALTDEEVSQVMSWVDTQK